MNDPVAQAVEASIDRRSAARGATVADPERTNPEWTNPEPNGICDRTGPGTPIGFDRLTA